MTRPPPRPYNKLSKTKWNVLDGSTVIKRQLDCWCVDRTWVVSSVVGMQQRRAISSRTYQGCSLWVCKRGNNQMLGPILTNFSQGFFSAKSLSRSLVGQIAVSKWRPFEVLYLKNNVSWMAYYLLNQSHQTKVGKNYRTPVLVAYRPNHKYSNEIGSTSKNCNVFLVDETTQ